MAPGAHLEHNVAQQENAGGAWVVKSSSSPSSSSSSPGGLPQSGSRSFPICLGHAVARRGMCGRGCGLERRATVVCGGRTCAQSGRVARAGQAHATGARRQQGVILKSIATAWLCQPTAARAARGGAAGRAPAVGRPHVPQAAVNNNSVNEKVLRKGRFLQTVGRRRAPAASGTRAPSRRRPCRAAAARALAAAEGPACAGGGARARRRARCKGATRAKC
ncbi:MAG: hypothetical protein J3K34DRAFT_448734 [Monoraphidium minutum]|nr:MAG: hypothetical protein J3K34DRAFT_448734 [Monoraphidium minutum]